MNILLLYLGVVIDAVQNFVTPDRVNGAFEGMASFMILNHTRALWKSRQADGVSLVSSVFFTTWGFWNIWYYPHLGQMFSFYAGIAVVSANVFWNYSIWFIRKSQNLRTPILIR